MQKCCPGASLVKITSSAYQSPGIELHLVSVLTVPLAKGFPLNIISRGCAFLSPSSAPLTCSIWEGREKSLSSLDFSLKVFYRKNSNCGGNLLFLSVYNVQGYCRNLLYWFAMAAYRYEMLALTLE